MEHGETIDIAFLETGLRINKDGLDDALISQPEFYRRAASAFAQAVSRRDGCKDELKAIEAKRYLEIRQTATEKLTEVAIKAMVDSSEEVIASRQEHLSACYEADTLEGLKEAFSQRAFMLKDLANLWVNGYFQSSSATGGNSRQVQERANDERRAQVAQARRKLDE